MSNYSENVYKYGHLPKHIGVKLEKIIKNEEIGLNMIAC